MSDTTYRLTRRAAMAAGAAMPFAAGLSLPRAAHAAAEMQGADYPRFNRFMLGDFEVTALLAGTRTVEDPHSIFGLNASDEDFAEASEDALIPADKAQFFFTPTLVNTGAELILFDTGMAPAGITSVLEAAGYAAEDIDIVVITHMHGDHIGGLADDSGPTFPNARYVTGQVEYDAWAGMDNEGFKTKVEPLADKMTFLEDGGTVVDGITAKAAFGHTPGHMCYLLESGEARLMLTADLANHYVWSLGYPDWEVSFDMDKEMAAESRKRILDMLAAEKMPFIGYHMPFPAIGYVRKEEDGFRFQPASYQMML